MNKIIFPQKRTMRGQPVADLHAGLRLILDKAAILAADEAARRAMATALQSEAAEQTFGDVTAKLVDRFQAERHLATGGEVDEATATALNKVLAELGVFTATSAATLTLSQLVSGTVTDAKGAPLKGVTVRATHESGGQSVRLGEAATDSDGSYAIRYETLPSGVPLTLRVSALDEAGQVIATSDPIPLPKPLAVVALKAGMGSVSGRVILEQGSPAGGLRLRLYRRDFGGSAKQLGEVTTDAGGGYSFPLGADSGAASVEIRAVKPDNSEVALCKAFALPAIGGRAGVNIVAPAGALKMDGEYRRLATDLKAQLGALSKLAKAREDSEQQDLSILNRATGWDARLIACAAVSERLAADADVKIGQEALFAMMRAGLPSEKALLARVAPDVVEAAMKKARESGVVELTDQQIAESKAQFVKFSANARMSAPAPGSRSSLSDLLTSSGIKDEARMKFSAVLLNRTGDAASLWSDARNAGVKEDEISALKWHGKMAFLSGNSAAMAKRLAKEIKKPGDLVGKDLHTAKSWKDWICAESGVPAEHLADPTPDEIKKLESVLPLGYAGKPGEQVDAYAADKARMVRQSYPTQVVARLFETDPKFKLASAHAGTVKMLQAATENGFRLGATPVTAFLDANAAVLSAAPEAERAAAKQQLKTLHRLYQISPGNEPMAVLMKLGITSAADVMAYRREKFVVKFDAKYRDMFGTPPPKGTADVITRKAAQVGSVTYSLFTTLRQLDSEVPMTALSASGDAAGEARGTILKQYPTMEQLFGSMDYCDCEHCRSVLSPAAYLVDLLQFVDREDGAWDAFLKTWKEEHGGAEYKSEWTVADGIRRKPYDALIADRPDLVNIPLTCENTHTALPYIDIVNEILEYYVANEKLDPAAARDTGPADSARLLAEPQNIIREAYDKLRDVKYPLCLPFDQPLETARAFCEGFGVPLHELIEAARPEDRVLSPDQLFERTVEAQVERLGISQSELAIFTDTDPLASWFKLYCYENETDAKKALNSAKALSRRLGVTYEELVELIETAFVNPELDKAVVLHRMGLSAGDARNYLADKSLLSKDYASLDAGQQTRYRAAAAVRDLLTGILGSDFGLKDDKLAAAMSRVEADLGAISMGRLLVLADSNAGCNFDSTILRFADGGDADAGALLRINIFVRLWRKLGWTIGEADRGLQTFIPSDVPYANASGSDAKAYFKKKPLKTALVYMSHLETLAAKVDLGPDARSRLLTFWSDITAGGARPLYRRLFLDRHAGKAVEVFDSLTGHFLQAFDAATGSYKAFAWDRVTSESIGKGNVSLASSLPAVQGAFGLAARDIELILTDAGKSLAAAELSSATLSLLYRHGLLASGLGLSVADLITLKRLSGIDPFASISRDVITARDQDMPLVRTLELVAVVEEVKASGLSIAELDYIVRHRADPAGGLNPDLDRIRGRLRGLSRNIAAIRAEHAVPADSSSVSDDVLRQKLGLLLPPDVVSRMLAMMNGTAEFTATSASNVTEADHLRIESFAGEPAIRDTPYDATLERQKLTYRGVLLDAAKADLKTRLPVSASGAHIASPVFAALLDDVQVQARAFFDRHLVTQSVEPQAGFLKAEDFDVLFAPAPAGETDDARASRLATRCGRLVEALLPALQRRLIRQIVIDTMTTETGGEPNLVASLVADRSFLSAVPLDALSALDGAGLTASFFSTPDPSNAPVAVVVLPHADTGLTTAAGAPLKPANAASVRIEGDLEVPASGSYRFHLELDNAQAVSRLRLPHLPQPVLLEKTTAAAASAVIELKAGVLYRFTLDASKLGTGNVRLLVQGQTLPKGPLSQLNLRPSSRVDAAQMAWLRLDKALRIARGLGLGERELRYIVTHAGDFGGIDLAALPVVAVGSTDPERTAAAQRFGWLRRLVAYTALKRDCAGGTDGLIGVFEAYRSENSAARAYPVIADLLRRDAAVVQTVAELLAKTASGSAAPVLASEPPLRRLWRALEVVDRLGVSPAALVSWREIVTASATSDQRFGIARDVREMLKAGCGAESWPAIVQPISDRLRRRQRDCLAAYTMSKLGLESMERLYERFLIDPGMEPVVQTSRIRLAISSVQLFIQRCLLNLEPRVHPSAINAEHWQWMKRYRVWEANRKIFLYPENWLEPEFRDDSTCMFDELAGRLLQDDVSSDVVEDALLDYLRQLEEISRLEIAAMHIEQSSGDPALRILHVIGRTYSDPRRYFYRRYAHQMWSPWEPVGAQIEGDHIVPVVWRNRLCVFWVTFMTKGAEPATDAAAGKKLTEVTVGEVITSPAAIVDAQLHYCEYVKGKWSARETASLDTVAQVYASEQLDPRTVPVYVSKSYDSDGSELGVSVHLGSPFHAYFYLPGRNAPLEVHSRRLHSNYYLPVHKRPLLPWPKNPFAGSAGAVVATGYRGYGGLSVAFTETITTSGSEGTEQKVDRKILTAGGDYTILPGNNEIAPPGIPAEAYASAAHPDDVEAAVRAAIGDIGLLVKPIFYQDAGSTFYVEPSVTEQTVEQWDDWVVGWRPEPDWRDPKWVKEISLIPALPKLPLPPEPGPLVLDPGSLIKETPQEDWLLNPRTGLHFGDAVVGPLGHAGLEVVKAPIVTSGVNADPLAGGLTLGMGGTPQIMTRDAGTLVGSGLSLDTESLSIVGAAGFGGSLVRRVTLPADALALPVGVVGGRGQGAMP